MTIVRLVPQDIELFAGKDKNLNCTVRDQNNQVVDLTGATIRWALSKTAKSTKLIDYTSPTNIAIDGDPTTGKFVVSIQDADTTGLPGGDYYHEAKVTSAAGLETTVFYGTVEMRDSITE